MDKELLRNEWRQRVNDFKSSGKLMTIWCKENNLRVHKLQYWLKVFGPKSEAKANQTKWITVDMNDKKEPSNTSIKIRIKKFEIEVNPDFDSKSLKEVLGIILELC